MTSVEFCSQLLSLEHSLLKFAYRLSHKRADAKDLVQETYLRALMNREKYVDNQKFKSWTFRIMKNTFIDNYRRCFRHNLISDHSIEVFFVDKNEPAGQDSPHSAYSAVEITENIQQLENKLRIPLQMFIDGYKYAEIADELNMKIGTVKNRIFLSRKQLMTQLNR